MSIQDLMKSFSNKTSTILCDNDRSFIRSASDSTEISDEDKLNFIALSLPPFSPSTDSVLETTTEKNNSNSNTILPVSQPNNGQPDSTLTATESDMDIDPSIRPMDAEAKINKNKRKKDQGAYYGFWDDMWAAISTSLNAVGNGPQKQAKEWQKTWRDWKSNVLKKCAQNKSYAGGTGGGPPKVFKLTELEENLLEIIGPEAAGLTDIPEGGNFNRIIQRESAPINNTTVKRGFAHNIYGELCETQEVGLKEHLSNSMLMKRKFTSTLATNKMYKIDDLVKNTSTSTSRIYDPDFSAQETEQNNCSQYNVDFNDIEEIDDIILEKKNTSPELCKHVIPKGVPDKAMSNKENSSAAVQLMRENTEIKQERLRISKEKLLFEKEKFDYLKNFYFDCKNILSNVDYNIMRLREEVEKMAPSYLT